MKVRSTVVALAVGIGLLLLSLLLITASADEQASEFAFDSLPIPIEAENAVSTVPEKDRASFVPGQLLVKLRPGVDLEVAQGKVQANDAELSAVLQQAGAISARRVFGDFAPSGDALRNPSASANAALRGVYLLTLGNNR